MAEAGSGAAGGYVAFISYSHRDAAIGRWLHRRLEGYRLPKRLAGTQGEDGEVPARLTPIFRDRDDLPAAGNLSEKVQAALAVSKNLIVVCSPSSAASPWVAKEIATFRELHPGQPIFTAIVEGEPGECFSSALREGGIEPLAADLRTEGDGRRLGLLKLVAGLAGVGLDALIQRDAARRIRQVTYVTIGSVAAMLAMALLTAVALTARAEAQAQRGKAERLVEFMLTDLRDKLKGVGRLDVLTAVNREALGYYRGQELRGLPAESLERRARILHLMGADDMDRDEADRALAEFREAARVTEALLADNPQDLDRIFAHSQSEFWIGRLDLDRNNYAQAKQAFERYRALVAKLVATDPRNGKWREELAYADGSLCTVALNGGMSLDTALATCTAALNNMQQAAQGSSESDKMAAIANRYAWLADVYHARGDLTRASRLRKRQEKMLCTLRKRDPANLDLVETWLTNQTAMAELDIARGELGGAQARLRPALILVETLTRADPANATWAARRQKIIDNLRQTEGQPMRPGRMKPCSVTAVTTA